MYQVPATRSSVVQFVMTCPGMSHSSTFTLHMRDSGEDETGEFGSYKDYKTGRVVRISRFIDVGVEYSHIPHNWDILETFLKTNAIIPVWVNCACRSWLGEVRGKLVNNTFDIIIVVD